MQTARKNDLYWTLNQAELHLQEGEKPGEVLVQIDTVTPNFKALLVSIDGGEWEERGADFVWRYNLEGQNQKFIAGLPKEAVERSGEFVWKLHEGENTLRIKPVNTFGIEGITSSAALHYTP